MPFSGADRPQIGISLLKAALHAKGFECDIRYFNHLLAEKVGPSLYQQFSGFIDHTIFAGEWLFAYHFFGEPLLDGNSYLRHIQRNLNASNETVGQILWMRQFIAPFLDECMRSVDWSRYSIIGFTSTFEQNLASLALAQRIKERYPEKLIVMGGANCEHPMGLAISRCFPFIDYVFSGEADDGFPEFVERIARRQPVDDIRGLVYRRGKKSIFAGSPEQVTEMDRLPFPNYDDYFAQLKGTSIPQHMIPTLQIETSRGCWWGAKHHCTFCGLNANSMNFRAKSQPRALKEILHLAERYPANQIAAVDNIIDNHYFRDLLPELKRRKLNLTLFYETKSNLHKEQVKLLSDAGVKMIQPGVESLHTHMLQLMRKGVSPLQNVQLLKWCKEYGVDPSWNLLYGFPGEHPSDYEEMLPLIQSIIHLDPPDGHGPIRLDRFSPYFQDPESFGLKNARPMAVYRYLYPLPDAELRDIAYFYQYEFADGTDPGRYIGPTLEQLGKWQEASMRGAALHASQTAKDLWVVDDSRPNAVWPRTELKGWVGELYDFCDQVRSLKAIHRWLAANAPKVSENEGREVLDRLVELKLIARDGDHYLSLALPAPAKKNPYAFLPYDAAGMGTQVMTN
jgi:ribosomal peptide maturation radical SAM protein 1